MKNLITLLLAAFISVIYNSNASEQQKVIAKFIITESTSNGYDQTEWDLKRGGYFAFYISDGNEFCLANVSKNTKDQSYGAISGMQSETISETDDSYESQIFTFRWKYFNTYNDKTGYARIALSKIFKPQGTIFTLRMVLPNLDVLEYKGYMEGTLDLSNFD